MGGGRGRAHMQMSMFVFVSKNITKQKFSNSTFFFNCGFLKTLRCLTNINLCDFVFSVRLVGGADIAWPQTRWRTNLQTPFTDQTERKTIIRITIIMVWEQQLCWQHLYHAVYKTHFTCIIMYYLLILCESDSSFREKLQDMYLLLPEDFTYELTVVVTADTRPTQAKDKVNLEIKHGERRWVWSPTLFWKVFDRYCKGVGWVIFL